VKLDSCVNKTTANAMPFFYVLREVVFSVRSAMQPVQEWSPFTAKVIYAFLINVGLFFFMFVLAMFARCTTYLLGRFTTRLSVGSTKKRS
jgi:hypothetical protein